MALTRNIVVIGGSTGGLDALRQILGALPVDFPAALFVVVHTAPVSPGVLPTILKRSSQLPVSYPEQEEKFLPGHVYVAPANRHLILKRDHMRLTSGPRENRFRPAVDPLFRTAAAAHGPRVIGIVLSGGLDDGSIGLALIKNAGGVAIVQDPLEALAPGMPQTALQTVAVDYVAGALEIGRLLERLVREPVEALEGAMRDQDIPDVSETGGHAMHDRKAGAPSRFTCPDCGGVLWEYSEGRLLQFQCHVGHRFGGDSLIASQSESLDHALWAGLRALEESSELRRRMADHARERGLPERAKEYYEAAEESEARAGLIRRVLIPESPQASADP